MRLRTLDVVCTASLVHSELCSLGHEMPPSALQRGMGTKAVGKSSRRMDVTWDKCIGVSADTTKLACDESIASSEVHNIVLVSSRSK